MAWYVNGTNLTMTEGDFGVGEKVKISGATLGGNDSLKFTFKDAANGNTILTKEFNGITNNEVTLEFTEAESALFPVGVYVYVLDWYQSGSFMCNILPASLFKVVDKA